MTRIENYVFSFCENLKKVVMSDNVSKINLQMFGACSNLEELIWRGKTYTFKDLVAYNEI